MLSNFCREGDIFMVFSLIFDRESQAFILLKHIFGQKHLPRR